MQKKILIGVAGFLALLVGLIVVVPGMIDWSTYKSDITDKVESLTGRKLTINGNIELTALPAPALIVSDVSFANVPGADTPRMVHLGSLEVRVALGPLLGGDIQVQKVKLVDPVIRLEVLPDGTPNWEITPPPSNGASIDLESDGQPVSDGAGAGGPGIQLDNVEVVNGTVVYDDIAKGVHEQVHQLNATFKAGSLQGPFESTGSLVFRDIPLSYEAAADGIFQGRTVPVSAIIRSGAADAEVQLNGNVLGFGESPRFKGSMSTKGSSLAELLYALVGTDGLPGVANQTFELAASVDASAVAVDLSDLNIRLGETGMQGALAVEMSDIVTATSEFSVSHVNVDTLMTLNSYQPSATDISEETRAENNQDGNNQPSHVSPSAPPGSQTLIPDTIAATTSLVIDALTFRGDKAGPVRINVELANGEITISQLSAQFPGASDAALFGFINEQDGVLVFEGESEVAIGDTRRLARWLDIDTSQIPKGRLRHISVTSNIRATPDQVQISELKAAFDNTGLTGGLTLALRNRLAFGASISLDRIDLDGYLPSQPAITESTAEAQSTATGEVTREPDSPLAGLQALTSFDANVRLRVGEIIHNDEAIKNLAIDGSLFNGDLTLENASAEDLAGASAKIKGRLSDLADNPRFDGLTVQFDAQSVARLADMAGLELPVPAKAIGKVAIDATLDGSVLQPAVKSSFSGLGATTTMDGRLSSLPTRPSIDAHITVNHDDTAALLKILGVSYDPSGDIGGLAFAGHVRGGADGVDLSDMTVTQGAIRALGSASVTLDQARPQLRVDLKANDIPVDPFLPAETAPPASSQATVEGTNSQSSGTGASSSGAPWSKEPLDLGVLNGLDADIQLQATGLRYGAIPMRNVSVAATLLDGVLTVKDISGDLFEGKLVINGTVNAQDVPSMKSTLDFRNGRVDSLLAAFTGDRAAVGTMTAGGDFTASGGSVDALVSGLNGAGSFAVSKLDVKSDSHGTPLAGVMGLVRALGQLGAGLGGQGSDGLADASGSFTVTDGVAQINDFALTSGFGNGAAKGFVDLGGWTMDVAGEVKLTQNLLTAALAGTTGASDTFPFSVRGVLDSPTVDLDTGALLPGGDGGAGALLPGLNTLGDKVPGLGTILQGVLGGGSTQQQEAPSSKSGDNTNTSESRSEPDSEPESTQQAPAQQQITPEAILDQLFNF